MQVQPNPGLIPKLVACNLAWYNLQNWHVGQVLLLNIFVFSFFYKQHCIARVTWVFSLFGKLYIRWRKKSITSKKLGFYVFKDWIFYGLKLLIFYIKNLYNRIPLKHNRQIKYCILHEKALQLVVLCDDTWYMILIIVYLVWNTDFHDNALLYITLGYKYWYQLKQHTCLIQD